MNRLIDSLLALAALAFAFAMTATIVDVVIRQLGPVAVRGVVELVTVAVVAGGFLALPASLRDGGHIVVDLATYRLSKQTIRKVDAVWLGLSAPLLAFIAVMIWRSTYDMFRRNEQLAELGAPAGLMWAIAAIGLSVAPIAALAVFGRNRDDNDDVAPRERGVSEG